MFRSLRLILVLTKIVICMPISAESIAADEGSVSKCAEALAQKSPGYSVAEVGGLRLADHPFTRMYQRPLANLDGNRQAFLVSPGGVQEAVIVENARQGLEPYANLISVYKVPRGYEIVSYRNIDDQRKLILHIQNPQKNWRGKDTSKNYVVVLDLSSSSASVESRIEKPDGKWHLSEVFPYKVHTTFPRTDLVPEGIEKLLEVIEEALNADANLVRVGNFVVGNPHTLLGYTQRSDGFYIYFLRQHPLEFDAPVASLSEVGETMANSNNDLTIVKISQDNPDLIQTHRVTIAGFFEFYILNTRHSADEFYLIGQPSVDSMYRDQRTPHGGSKLIKVHLDPHPWKPIGQF